MCNCTVVVFDADNMGVYNCNVVVFDAKLGDSEELAVTHPLI